MLSEEKGFLGTLSRANESLTQRKRKRKEGRQEGKEEGGKKGGREEKQKGRERGEGGRKKGRKEKGRKKEREREEMEKERKKEKLWMGLIINFCKTQNSGLRSKEGKTARPNKPAQQMQHARGFIVVCAKG